MTGEQVKVDLARLSSAVNELQAFNQTIAEQLAELEGRVSALHTSWGGEAASKHAEAHIEWHEGAQRLADGVKRLRAVSTAAHDNYRSTIESNRARFA